MVTCCCTMTSCSSAAASAVTYASTSCALLLMPAACCMRSNCSSASASCDTQPVSGTAWHAMECVLCMLWNKCSGVQCMLLWSACFELFHRDQMPVCCSPLDIVWVLCVVLDCNKIWWCQQWLNKIYLRAGTDSLIPKRPHLMLLVITAHR